MPDTVRLMRQVEQLRIPWLENLFSGGYVPYADAASYREVTWGPATPIHIGEQQ